MSLQQPAGASARANTLQRGMSAWHSLERYYSRHAGEFWDIRIPLMTMVGLTLIGLYDCKAVTLNAPAGDLSQVQAQECAELEPQAAAQGDASAVAGQNQAGTADLAVAFRKWLGAASAPAETTRSALPINTEFATRQLRLLCATIHANAPPVQI